MGKIILEGITINELICELKKELEKSARENRCKEISKESKSEYITRAETCKVLSISKPTLNSWTKTGKLTSYKIGSRVLYKITEVNDAVSKRSFSKFNGKEGGNA